MAITVLLRALAWTLLGFAVGVWLAVLAARIVQLQLPHEWVWFFALLGVAVVGAVAWAIQRRPTAREAAVAIDLRLELKEKFSTALYARPLKDPFAVAMVRDAERTADNTSLAKRFPIEFPRVWGVTAAVTIVVLLTGWLLPSMDLFGVQAAKQKKAEQAYAQKARAEHSVRQAIAQIEATPRAVAESEPLKLAKQDLSEMLKRPIDDPVTAQRKAESALKEIDAVKEKIKENQRFAEAQNEIKEFQSLSLPPEEAGPVADASRAIAKGNFSDAVENIKDAVEKFDKMDPKEQQKAAQQMAQLAQKMQQMADDPKAQQQMQQQLRQMGANQQQAQQMTQLMQQAANGNQPAQQQLQQMANQVAQQANQKQGGSPQQQQQAAQQIQKAVQQMQQKANGQASAQQMASSAQRLAKSMQQAAKRGQQGQQQAHGGQNGQQGQSSAQQMAQAGQSMQQQLGQLQAMAKDQQAVAAGQQGGQDGQNGQQGGQGQGQDRQGQGGQGQKGEWAKGDPNQHGQGGQGGPAMAAGARPNPQEAPYGVKQEVTNYQTDDKGKILASSFVKAGSIKGESKVGLSNDALKDYQEATDEVDEDRIPRSASHAVKDYFETLKRSVN
jgi:hypothetical protein